jgi:hypothetical protein
MKKQPEAIRLADALTTPYTEVNREAANELRRLHEEVEVLMNALSKAYGDDEETVLRAINAQRPDYEEDDETPPNHYCYGRIVHLPNGEECSACGKATGETE